MYSVNYILVFLIYSQLSVLAVVSKEVLSIAVFILVFYQSLKFLYHDNPTISCVYCIVGE